LRAASLFFAFAFAAAAMLVRVGSSARAASSQCGRRSLSVNFFSQLFACALVGLHSRPACTLRILAQKVHFYRVSFTFEESPDAHHFFTSFIQYAQF